MAEVIFAGPAGRIEGRLYEAKGEKAPIALILHSHPRAGGSMQDRVTLQLFKCFVRFGFSVLRFNFRGVGRSAGVFDNSYGELSDAACALDYLQTLNPSAEQCWVAGHSFGSVLALQLLMRRPEIVGFVAVAPTVNHHDLSFLAPCPSNGLIVFGTQDRVAPPADVERTVQRIRTQKNIKIDTRPAEGANHLFETGLEHVERETLVYLEKKLGRAPGPEDLDEDL
jgi:uncharacterized protein